MNNSRNKFTTQNLNLTYEDQVKLMVDTGYYLETSNISGGLRDLINKDFSKFVKLNKTYNTIEGAWIGFVKNTLK